VIYRVKLAWSTPRWSADSINTHPALATRELPHPHDNDRPASPCCKWETSQGTSSRSHDHIKLTHDRRPRAMTDDCIHDDGMARGILAHNSLSLRVGVGAKCPVRCGGGSRPWSPASLSRTTAELGHSTLMLPLASPPSREEIELGARPLAALLHSTGWAGTSEPWLPP
jgi:hypothetical protein